MQYNDPVRWRRRKRSMLAIGGMVAAGVILIGFVVAANPAATPSPGPQFVRHSLANATSEEIGQEALSYVHNDFDIRSGTPKIVLSRSVTEDDLPGLGLGRVSFGASVHPPLALVILKGDFGQGHFLGTGVSATDQFIYVAYIYDLWAGAPTSTIASKDGGIFRQALGDSTLPIVPTIPAGPPQPTSAVFLPYGGVAPTVTFGQVPQAPTPIGLPTAPHP